MTEKLYNKLRDMDGLRSLTRDDWKAIRGQGIKIRSSTSAIISVSAPVVNTEKCTN